MFCCRHGKIAEPYPMLRRLPLICLLGSCVGMVVIALNPLHISFLKVALLGCVAGAWAGFTLLIWKRKPLRLLALMLPLLASALFVLPGREIDGAELQQDYVRRMSELEGTEYFWGGESSRGIDCSGLPRLGLRKALLSYGIRHLNGRALRAFAEQWWFDASAMALGEGYRDFTRPVGVSGNIRKMDYGSLKPGDLAITSNGVHVLAYAGDGRWIQADPGIGAVATLDGRTGDNTWFKTSVEVYRWRILE